VAAAATVVVATVATVAVAAVALVVAAVAQKHALRAHRDDSGGAGLAQSCAARSYQLCTTAHSHSAAQQMSRLASKCICRRQISYASTLMRPAGAQPGLVCFVDFVMRLYEGARLVALNWPLDLRALFINV
jgi:hypothetical protein